MQHKTTARYLLLSVILYNTICLNGQSHEDYEYNFPVKKHPKAYFYINEGDERCFIANAPGVMPLTATYSFRENAGITCTITFKDPEGLVVFSRRAAHADPAEDVRVSYLTKDSGDYQICISCPASQWFATSKIKWTISIELGDSDDLYPDTAKQNEVHSLSESLTTAAHRLNIIEAENRHQKEEEERYRFVTDSLNFRFMVFAVIKTLLLLLCTSFSVIHLGRYFHREKLI